MTPAGMDARAVLIAYLGDRLNAIDEARQKNPRIRAPLGNTDASAPTAPPRRRVVLDDVVRRTLDLAPGELNDLGFYVMRQWPDGRWVALEPMTFKHVRLVVSALATSDPMRAFDSGYVDTWEFPSKEIALEQFTAWNGEGWPAGWSRHPLTCRRRQPDGTAHVRLRELPFDLLAQLQESVRAGAGHECDEWWGEAHSLAAGRCVLCGKRRSL